MRLDVTLNLDDVGFKDVLMLVRQVLPKWSTVDLNAEVHYFIIN